MKARPRFWMAASFSLGILLLAARPTPPAPERTDHPTPVAMAEAAQAFLQTLDGRARQRATFAFDDEERYNWHYVPRARAGLPLGDMTEPQRRAAHALLQSALSTQGYLKATSIIYLESILKVLENGSDRRDPERYYFSLFGDPAGAAPWGWRLEGHHLSLNFSSVTGEVAATPSFFGANPHLVPSGPFQGLRILAGEEDRGRALMNALDASQRARALLSATAPADIITTNDRRARLDGFEGLPAADMNEAQRTLLLQLLEAYVHNLQHDLAHAEMEKLRSAGIGRLYFAWAGSLTPGEKHYYRVHGPTVLFEYDNTQNDANHVHAVWRSFDGDWGEDLLRRHYDTSRPGHGH